MAAVNKSGKPSMCSKTPGPEHSITLYAGEAIGAGDAMYIKTSDGKFWKATGAAANDAAKARYFAAKDTQVDEAVTGYRGVNFRYGTGLQPGIDLYLSGTVAGGLDTAASTGGTTPIAFVIDATRIHVRGN